MRKRCSGVRLCLIPLPTYTFHLITHHSGMFLLRGIQINANFFKLV